MATGKISFFIDRDEITAPGFATVFGPETRADDPLTLTLPGKLSLETVFTVSANSAIKAPCDCGISIVTDPVARVDYLALRLYPLPILRKISQLGLLSEIPTVILLNKSELKFKGLEEDPNYQGFFQEYLSKPPRNTLAGADLQEAVRQRIEMGKIDVLFPSGSEFARTRANTLSMRVLTTPRIRALRESLGTAEMPAAAYWPEVERRNSMDPVAFWAALVRAAQQHNLDVFTSNADLDAAKHWFGSADRTPQRITIELRDEHNIPMSETDPRARWIQVQSTGGLATVGGADNRLLLSQSRAGFLVVPTATTQIQFVSIRSSTTAVVSAVDEQFVFWNMSTGSSHADKCGPVDVQGPAHIVLQAIRPADWFSRQEAAVEPGWSKLKRYTTDNDVVALIDGHEYFDDLVTEIRMVDGGRTTDHIHIACWHIEGDFDLSGPGTSLSDLFAEPSQSDGTKLRGSRTRILKFDMPLPLEPNFPEPPTQFRSLVDFLSDDQGLQKTANPLDQCAHHMKILTINGATELIAYCGGIDIVADRLTDQTHAECEGFLRGLHDVQLRFKGPAAFELDQVFFMRWHSNSGAQPYNSLRDQGGRPNTGSNMVQVSCTIPTPDPGRAYKMANNGDRTLLATLTKAIRNAKQFIYIEDQYFSNLQIAKLIRQRLPELEFVVVVLPREAAPFEGLGRPDLDESFENIMRRILNDNFSYDSGESRTTMSKDEVMARMQICYIEAGKRFSFVTTREPFAYVHAKLMIIDDLFVSCGSANLDSRGLGTDPSGNSSTECNTMIIDAQVLQDGARRFARDFRIRLWAEHIGSPIPRYTPVGNSPLFASLSDPRVAYHCFWKDPERENPYCKTYTSRIRTHPGWRV